MALEAGTAYIDVLPLLKNFSSELKRQATPALASAARKMQAVAGPMRTAGRNLTRYVTLPVLGLGIAAGKVAVDFGSAMARVQANSNLTAEQVKGFREQILELAGTTAQAPIELANGLYFLASAGLRAKQITDILGASAKASAAGMGEVSDVAKITANALNAYRGSGLKAAQVTDALAAAVKAGSAEPDEFAGALGRILPAASKANVSFQEITASLAALSNIGLDVDEGVTAMRGVLLALEAPGTQAAQTLKEIGLSADQVRSAIADRGLAGAFDLLMKASHGNIDTLRKIVPNVRSLTGLFGLTGNKAQAYADALDQVNHSQGALNDAFETTKKEDPAFQWEQLKANLQVTSIHLGRVLIPLFTKLVDAVEKGVKWFTSLSDATQENIVKWGLLLAVVGPFLRILSAGLGTVASMASLMVKLGASTAGAEAAATGATGAFGGLVLPVTLVGAAIAFAVVQTIRSNAAMEDAIHKIEVYGEKSAEAAGSVDKLGGAIKDTTKGAKEAADRLPFVGAFQDRFNSGVKEGARRHREWFRALNDSTAGLKAYDEVMVHADRISEHEATNIAILMDSFIGLGGKLTKSREAQIESNLAMGRGRDVAKDLKRWIEQIPEVKTSTFHFPGLAEGLRQLKEFNALIHAGGGVVQIDPRTGQGHSTGGRRPPGPGPDANKVTVKLVVDDQEFGAYLEGVADSRIADERAFRTGLARMNP